MRRITVLAATFAALLLAVSSPAPAQESVEKVEGIFRLTLNGEAPENVSFWVETSAGGEGGVICTTDAAMVSAEIDECRDGGAANEMAYAAPADGDVEYRIVGSQGTGLSQEVVAEGSTAAEEGFVVEASYTFSDEPVGGAPKGTSPDGDGAARDQYEDESGGADRDDPGDKEGSDEKNEKADAKESSEARPGVLPDTGGVSPVATVGALLLLAAGGFVAHRTVRQAITSGSGTGE